jgi:hypothetical protein
MFLRDWVEALELELSFCEYLDPDLGAAQLIHLIRQHGGEFLKLNRHEVEPNPLPDLIHLFVHIEHDLLRPDALTPPRRGRGQASLSFLPNSLTVIISQNVSFPDLRQVDPVALGLLDLGRRLYPDLRPRYAWIDERSGNVPEDSEIAAVRLQYIFWANFWGPAYVERYGRDFLRGAPGWRVGGPGRWRHSVCHHRQLRGVVADGPPRAPGSGAPAIAKVAPRTARAAGRATSHPPGILPNTDPRHRALLGKGGTGLNGHAPGTRVERPSGKPFPFTRPRPRPGSLPPARLHGAGAREPTGPEPVCLCLQQSNNPLRYTDPMGHCPWCIAAGIALIVLKVLDYSWTAYDSGRRGGA